MMSKEFGNKLLKIFKKRDHFANHNNIEVLEACDGRARAQVKLTKEHMNGLNIAHGGILFSLADVTFGLAANSHGRVAVTLSADISFFNPSEVGQIIIAEAEELSLKNRIASYLISIRNEDGLLLASMKCSAYRKEEISKFAGA